MMRPMPPEHLAGGFGAVEPAHEVGLWAYRTIINDGATVQNEDHEHLQRARIGFLWTNEPNEKKGRTLLGTCRLLPPSGDKWSTAQYMQQINEWFEDEPHFIITLYAPACFEMDDASFMALLEHELYHAAPKLDNFGQPMFAKETGEPLWAIRGHDVEQFVGVVRRYGAEASGTAMLVDAANRDPEVAQAQISIACGTCQ